MSDMWTEIYLQEQKSDSANVARAKVAAIAVARDELSAFVKKGANQAERDIRLSLAAGRIEEIVGHTSEQYGVQPGEVFGDVYAKLAAEVAVTDPETKDIESGIGGEEGKKYQDSKEVDKGDGETDTGELKAVVEEPVRHKLVEGDDLGPADEVKHSEKNPASDSKAFPGKASAVEKTAMDDNATKQVFFEGFKAGRSMPDEDPEKLYELYLSEVVGQEATWGNEPFAPRDRNRDY
jgi:hypothetical protein